MSNNPFYNNDPFNVTGLGHGADWGTRRPYDARSHSAWGPGSGSLQSSSIPYHTSSDMRYLGPYMSYPLDPDSPRGGSWYGPYGGSRWGGGGRNVRSPSPPRGSGYYDDFEEYGGEQYGGGGWGGRSRSGSPPRGPGYYDDFDERW